MKIKCCQKSISDIDMGKRKAIVKFATYNTPDRDGDRANKGMFTKSWQEFTDVRLFENHDKLRAPGKIMKLYEDNNHAYAELKLGTHTLGEDVLKQMDEEIITDSSYLFFPTKFTKMGKGYNYTEVFHKEVSVLTHWGAHPESKVMSVEKELKEYMGRFSIGDKVSARVGKQHMEGHETMRMTVVETDYVFYAVMLPDGSIHKWYRGDELTPNDDDMKPMPAMSMKEMSDLSERLLRLKSFCKNTTASDECIQNILKEAEQIERILSSTAAAEKALQQPEQDKDEIAKSHNENDDDLSLQLLNLTMMLQ